MVTPLFDAKYLTNGYRYGHSYYRRRIGNRTQAFEWHQFQWPWVTSKPDFKVAIWYYSTSNNSQMVQDRAIVTMADKPDFRVMVYRTVPFSMTLKDPKPRFQGQAILWAEYLQNGCRYGHSYYGRRIGNRTQAFKWYYFQWVVVE